MWLEEFEEQLTSAFLAYDKHERGANVHSNEMKIRILLDKVNVEFLAHARMSLRNAMQKLQLRHTCMCTKKR